jgi:hypothetical protein
MVVVTRLSSRCLRRRDAVAAYESQGVGVRRQPGACRSDGLRPLVHVRMQTEEVDVAVPHKMPHGRFEDENEDGLVLVVRSAADRGRRPGAKVSCMSEPVDLEALAETLRRLLAEIDDGALTARPSSRHRIEGALAVVEVLLGEEASLLLDRLDDAGLNSK